MTLTMFTKLYSHYKENWSIEMRMFNANMTYEDLYNKTQKAEEWF